MTAATVFVDGTPDWTTAPASRIKNFRGFAHCDAPLRKALQERYGCAGSDMSENDNAQGERIARLETELAHVRVQLAEMGQKVDSIHDIMLQAKGARWLMLAAASVGGFVATKIVTYVGWNPFK